LYKFLFKGERAGDAKHSGDLKKRKENHAKKVVIGDFDYYHRCNPLCRMHPAGSAIR
jgi:hypothetical protein